MSGCENYVAEDAWRTLELLSKNKKYNSNERELFYYREDCTEHEEDDGIYEAFAIFTIREIDGNEASDQSYICIRGINESVIKSLDQAAGKRDISREEYLRQCLERIAYDDRALENRYVQQLQKLTSCIQQQQNQLNILTDSIKEIAEYTIQKESEFEG